MEGFDRATYGERFADVYDEWYDGVSDVEGTVEVVAALAAGGAVLELGIGTGRIAIPLVALGLEVHGIEASTAMLARLRAKPGGASLPVVVGDFADVAIDVPGGFAVVVLAYNTLFNLATAELQRRCLANAAGRLRPGGWLAIEAFVPSSPPSTGPSSTGMVTPARVEADEVVLQVTRRDHATQTVSGSIVSITEAGIRLRPWHIRYAPPEEIDTMATEAGLELVHRWAGWRRERYTDESPGHVTLYRRSSEYGQG